jgi:serine/threonine protein kinase
LGEKVHEWSILQKIGMGAFGSVYQGFDSIKGKPIAIKQLDIENNNKSKSKVEALELEIDLLTKVNHKNIVTYHG